MLIVCRFMAGSGGLKSEVCLVLSAAMLSCMTVCIYISPYFHVYRIVSIRTAASASVLSHAHTGCVYAHARPFVAWA